MLERAKQQSGDNYKTKKEKKKEKMEIKLPNIRQSIARRNMMAQGRQSYEDFYKFIGGILIAGVVLFILLGGINQRKFIESFINIGENIGETFKHVFNLNSLDVTDDGIYINPERAKEDIESALEEIQK